MKKKSKLYELPFRVGNLVQDRWEWKLGIGTVNKITARRIYITFDNSFKELTAYDFTHAKLFLVLYNARFRKECKTALIPKQKYNF